MILGHGRLYVAGEWTGRFIHALEPTSGADLPWTPYLYHSDLHFIGYDHVEAIQVVGNVVYAGGYFPHSGGIPLLTNLVAMDRDTAALLPQVPAANERVRSLVAAGNFLYVGGEFTVLGGQPRHGLAAIELSTGNVTPWNPSGTNLNTIRALGVSGNTVYAAGNFQEIGGQGRTNLAALDATTGEATAWQPSVTNQINALVVAGDTVYVGGGQDFPVNSYLGVFPPQGWSVLSQARLTNGNFSFRLLGEEGSNYVIQASATLTNWSSVHTNTVTNGGFDFTAPATNLAPRFYRARPGP